MKFIDHVTINIRAGKGGNGCVAFLREKFRPKGGPSGGDGGHGGSIVFEGSAQLSTLQDVGYRKFYRAENGVNGGGDKMHGKKGNDLVIKVPLGTIVKNKSLNQVIADIVNDGEQHVIAKGGNGGFGNARFKSQTNTAPTHANKGKEGQEFDIDLELKVLADIGIVGLPNAGKSTYISKVSNAKPKIKDYPFTTLTPNLGIVKYGQYNTFVIADIPGIIEGASDGKGLGIQFLKHIERTRILAFMIEATSDDILADYKLLRQELQEYDPKLNDKKSILFISKIDIVNNSTEEIENIPKDIDIEFISSVTGKNIESSISKLSHLL